MKVVQVFPQKPKGDICYLPNLHIPHFVFKLIDKRLSKREIECFVCLTYLCFSLGYFFYMELGKSWLFSYLLVSCYYLCFCFLI